MSSNGSQNEINDVVWRACDTFRGAVDPAEYKNYILTMLFIKYISDLWEDKREELNKKYNGNQTRIERSMNRSRFILPKEASFKYLYENRESNNIGEKINIALEQIEDQNKKKLGNVFRNIDFNSEAALGQTRERNRRLKNLLLDFADPRLDLRPSRIGNRDVIGDVYEYLIGRFAAGAGKKAGEFYTPPEVSNLLAKLVAAKQGNRICDPACGSGSLLIRVAKEIGSDNYYVAGQESNGATWSLCRMNMFLHDMDGARIEWCDSIVHPTLVEGDELMKFDIVIANPPFSLDKWGAEDVKEDKYKRFYRGMPPKSKGDYAFITHMVEITDKDHGKVAVIVPHGVLFRGGAEGLIRRRFIETENILEAVIGLPAQLFFGTGIPAAVLLFNRGRKKWAEAKTKRDRHVLFIDASREFLDGKKQNFLRERDIDKIVTIFHDFREVEKYSHLATLDEIREADFNLNIPRFVDTFEEEEDIDIGAVRAEIKEIEAELAQTEKEMETYLRELGID